jgi:hypothetical protein
VNEIVIALIGSGGLVGVALIEAGRRTSKKRWESNKDDHNFVVDKIEQLGKSLGASIDRVEDTAIRTEEKLDLHINDHVTGRLANKK